MKNKKKLSAFCCVIALAVTCAVPAFASSTTWSGPLPGGRTGIDLAYGTHDTSTKQASVSVKTMGGGYTRVYFTIRRDNESKGYENVTSTKTCSKGYSTNMPYTKSVAKGEDLVLNGGNDKWTGVNVDATGDVNFN